MKEGSPMNKEITIVVATHKYSPMPTDRMYLPLQVGAAINKDNKGQLIDLGFAKDNTGDNISDKNPFFGTQTALYWAWKNLDCDYKGLVHYRRYFVGENRKKDDMLGSVITYDEIKPQLCKYKVFVPKKRWYVIETLQSHYAHTHDEKHLSIVRNIIQQDSPEYLKAFEKIMMRRWGYMFNMMIMQKDMMDDYCTWLFNILFQLFEQVDKKGLSAFDSRFCRRVSEILFDVWLERKIEAGQLKKQEIKELSYIEDVNWNYKIKAFITAKLFHKKYGRSS